MQDVNMENCYAILDKDGVVLQVIVADKDHIDKHPLKDGMTYVATDSGGVASKNFAGIGAKYEKDLGGFATKKPYDSWLMDEKTLRWKPPFALPEGNNPEYFEWNEKGGCYDKIGKAPGNVPGRIEDPRKPISLEPVRHSDII